MIEVYTQNAELNANQIIPLSSVSLKKGCTATLDGNTINLHQNGVYAISVDAVLTSATVGLASIQMNRNGVAVPQAISSGTIGTANDSVALGFETLVRVSNCPCECETVALTFENIGVASTVDINVVVTKVC